MKCPYCHKPFAEMTDPESHLIGCHCHAMQYGTEHQDISDAITKRAERLRKGQTRQCLTTK